VQRIIDAYDKEDAKRELERKEEK
jgi:hypothetical protein